VQPYLTFVVAARNDNYGGDFLHRMQVSVSSLFALANRHDVCAELIVVEWNPPADRASLREAIDWRPIGDRMTVRLITVPYDFHRTLPNATKMPMFEYWAKNVGIRRATGKFVLATNPDIVFSDGLLAYLARNAPPRDSFLTADRHDVQKRIPFDISVDEMLAFCRRNVIGIWTSSNRVDPRSSTKVRSFLLRPSPVRLLRWMRREAKPCLSKPPIGPIEAKPTTLAVGAPGDFLLTTREQWHCLRGFPELPTHSFLDNYFVHLASAAGLRRLVLPYPIYHQEHDRGEHLVRPATVLLSLPAFREIYERQRPVITNSENWGLGSVSLPECSIQCPPHSRSELLGTRAS